MASSATTKITIRAIVHPGKLLLPLLPGGGGLAPGAVAAVPLAPGAVAAVPLLRSTCCDTSTV